MPPIAPYQKNNPGLIIVNFPRAFSLQSHGRLQVECYKGKVLYILEIDAPSLHILLSTPCEIPGVTPRVKALAKDIWEGEEHNRVVYRKGREFGYVDLMEMMHDQGWRGSLPLFDPRETIPPFGSGEHLKHLLRVHGYNIDVI